MTDQHNTLLTYYGDDFTGSTDVMEALVRGGVEAVMFIDPPTAEQLARYPHARAVGVAGLTRSMPPDAMQRALEPAFARLAELGAPLLHYKICSTFDSSPTVGSIGKAIDLGQRHVAGRFIPLVVGAPVLGRYTVFGNLFARSGLDSEPYRLDRHPTMSRHPVTPMDEADLRLHLARQTEIPIELFSVLDHDGAADAIDARLDALAADGPRIVLFDVLEPRHLATIGRVLWQRSAAKPMFVVGSSGVEYALVAHWRETGLLAHDAPAMTLTPGPRLVVLSGSCSPVTARQIGLAVSEHGFADVAVDVTQLTDGDAARREQQRIIDAMADHLRAGRCPIAHLACGPDDPRIDQVRHAGLHGDAIGRWLGTLACHVARAIEPDRIIITGGDTSGHVARAMGIEALTMLAPLAPGSPLCRAAAPGSAPASQADDIEICFKGGQVGRDDFFATARDGAESC